ncbi:MULTISPECIES: TetR/AcrR family transcriptional regulator [unclassified Paenibacillus]|uniref:TetR/AcrR family transcriptional regulator n=1 Tax=unclassified Paenibacillus TaxID=185978 RepID=UPI0009553185|nr:MULTISPECIES: TetR/AcrR family transcriptional regulator [unclassified Paenibacillus]ASS68485.1 TetR/AcrR family transcriptional regulator [Paenibacillus sp. RUD330]SIR35048.1 transcriptional regulator, TetR family [Paenibacillus sp. RU4X]SIR45767.1 transcriptional regulator, TetR family [Paenibacillus sp. RU4T]
MSSIYKRKESQELSESILETARALFAEHGVDAVSMHQIAKTAGVGQGTLYRRYSQKGELCMELMEGYFDRLQKDVLHSLTANASLAVKERATLVIRELVLNLMNNIQLMETIYAAIFAGRKCEKEISTFFESPPYQFLFGTLQGLLQEAVDTGAAAPGVCPPVNAHLLISTLAPQSLNHLRDQTGFSPEELAAVINRTIVLPLFV